MTKRCFPDVNVWFALVLDEHPHHLTALEWWNRESLVAGFSRVTQIGLLRLLTTASAMGGAPITNDQAWGVYDALLGDSRVRLFPELSSSDELFRSLSRGGRPSPKVWADAYIAAQAAANEAAVITFDKAFASLGESG